ncbi:MAG: EMC3/TMCO1 family protein [Candidatus Thermoplasmatota archaeon]|nr:EMC3/TMCO1 family protein [Candidatus Thermoplasmatota archaeon]MDI6887227.1 EMC3/TMCO1 family protein [Candidatus Thermoplasmatota archaeon]
MESQTKNAIIRFIAIFSFLLALFMIFDASLREASCKGVDYLFQTISFQSKPLLTIFIVAVLLIFITTVIRHFLVDWLKLAKQQKIMAAFQKELRDAQLSKNFYKLKKLTELQAEIMKEQSGVMLANFKPMGIIMVIVIPVFAWLYKFVDSLPTKEINIIGNFQISLIDKGPLFHFFPWWLIIYFFMSIPFGSIFQKGLRVISYRNKLK